MRRSTPDARRSRRARRLGDVHEAVDQFLQRVAERPGRADPSTWTWLRGHLDRLVRLERRMLLELRDREVIEPIPTALDPTREAFQWEFAEQLGHAGGLAERGAPWPETVAELTEFLGWSFIAVEDSLRGR